MKLMVPVPCKARKFFEDNFEGQPEDMMVSCLYRRVEKRSGKLEQPLLYRRQAAYLCRLRALSRPARVQCVNSIKCPSSALYGANLEGRLTELAGYASSIYTYIFTVGSKASKGSSLALGNRSEG